jgi:hypothetical protein
MKKQGVFYLVCSIIILTAINSCKKDDDENDEGPVELINTFGPDDSYISGSGWTLGYDLGSSYIQAIGFIPDTAGTVSQYRIAVCRIEGGDKLNAWLLSDDDDYPNDTIEKFSFTVPEGTHTGMIITAGSSVQPVLDDETRYWLVIAPPDLENELFVWYRNHEIEGIYNAQSHGPAGPWNVTEGDYAPTLKIIGYR